MPGKDIKTNLRVIGRGKKREPEDVIPMGVGHQQCKVIYPTVTGARTKITNARSRIQDNVMISHNNFNATGIPTINDMLGRRTGNAASDTPKLDRCLHHAPTALNIQPVPVRITLRPVYRFVSTSNTGFYPRTDTPAVAAITRTGVPR